ncbi:MAG: hypothetical protein ACC628_07635 [Pirellulaceae bacterium]
MPFQTPTDLSLIFPPFRRLAVEKMDGDPSIQFVEVHLVDSVLEPGIFGLQSLDRFFVKAFLVNVAVA